MTLALSAELLRLGGLHADIAAARAAAERALDQGAAAERFAAMVAELGGPADLLERPEQYLPSAPILGPVDPLAGGVITAIDVRAVGLAIIGLGGGRARETDAIDHAVGFTEIAGLGERVGPGERRSPLSMRGRRRRPSGLRLSSARRSRSVKSHRQLPTR